MFHQYYAQRFRSLYPSTPKQVGDKTIYEPDPKDKKIGTIPVGTMLYIQDDVRPLHGLTREVICREPWMVEAWIPRNYSKWDDLAKKFITVRAAGGHLAVVRSLRDRRKVQEVADWILLACLDAGLEKGCSGGPAKDLPGPTRLAYPICVCQMRHSDRGSP